MSSRITIGDLTAVMHRMERSLGIATGPTWTRDEAGHMKARVGALVLQRGSRTYGNAWAISQLMNEGGGEKTIVRGSTARELFDAAYNWLSGFDARVQS